MKTMALPRKSDQPTLEILAALEATAHRIGVDIEYKKLPFDGGLCFISKKPHLILNRELGVGEKCRALLRALKKFPLEEIFIPEHIRTLLDKLES